MTFRTAALWLALISLLSVSLALKVMAASDQEREHDVRRSVVEAITAAAKWHELELVDRHKLTVDGTFEVLDFQHFSCAGDRLGVVPMMRNSEATGSISDAVQNKSVTTFYIYNGQVFLEFPSMEFWWGRHIEKLSRLLGRIPNLGRLYVAAVINVGDCVRIDELARSFSKA